jgi:ferredoxin-NADP reductase
LHPRGQIQVGGDWFLKRRKNEQKNLLLIAGGVGINPILSMLRKFDKNYN